MNIQSIEQAIEEGNSLKTLAQAFGEISSTKIKKIRSEVERNRSFLLELAGIYALIKKVAASKNINFQKPKRSVSLIITSNYGFYGSINNQLMKFSVEKTLNTNTDRVIIGTSGLEYLKAFRLHSSYRSIILKGDFPSPEELQQLAEAVSEYNQVLVYYSQLKSLLVQKPTVADITQAQSSLDIQPALSGKEDNFHFIFEPQIEKILVFFSSQIINLLLEQTFLESELSRTASRMISMDEAQVQAKKFIKEHVRLRAYTKRVSTDNQNLEQLASLAALKKEKYT